MFATDMLVHAVWNNYDVAILVSSDADFEPVVRRVRDLGKKVYISFYLHAIADKLVEASNGIMPFHLESLIMKHLTITIVSDFKEELLSSINALIEELETRSYFKPLLKLRNIKKDIECIKRGLQNLNLADILKPLEELQKHTTSIYLQTRNIVPYKYYLQPTFKASFYKELIKKHIQGPT